MGTDCCKRHPRTSSCQQQQQHKDQLGRRPSHLDVEPDRPAAASVASSGTTVHLRDDMFIVHRSGDRDDRRPTNASILAAPPVVRAYEACAATDVVDRRLQAAWQASSSARTAVIEAPLPIAAILFFGTHLERLPLLRAAYSPYFHSLVFMSLSAEILSHGRRHNATLRQRHHYHHCRSLLKTTYTCVSDVAARYTRHPGVRGILYLHFDLWVQPWELARPSSPILDAPWALPPFRIMVKAPGPTRLLPIDCFNASRAAEYVTLYKTPLPGTALRGSKKRTVPAWTWGRDVPAAIAGLRDACAEAQGWGQCDPDRLCIGWADLYYVPRSMYASFGWLSRQFGRHSANAELAVPTMMRLLSDWAHTSLRRLPCWGFCCSSTPCPELLLRHACGHRMRLEVPRMRAAFEQYWRAR